MTDGERALFSSLWSVCVPLSVWCVPLSVCLSVCLSFVHLCLCACVLSVNSVSSLQPAISSPNQSTTTERHVLCLPFARTV
eukprot:COSAG02_NODE_9032_length_2355_cov_1.647606_2_plen_81_part_00